MDIPTVIALVGGIAGIVGGIGGIIGGIGGYRAGVAAQKTANDAVRMAQEAKTDPHRDALYQKRLQVLEMLFHILVDRVADVIFDDHLSETQGLENLNLILLENQWLLPTEIYNQMQELIIVSSNLSTRPAGERRHNLQPMLDAFNKTVTKTRNFLGIDPLDYELSKILFVDEHERRGRVLEKTAGRTSPIGKARERIVDQSR